MTDDETPTAKRPANGLLKRLWGHMNGQLVAGIVAGIVVLIVSAIFLRSGGSDSQAPPAPGSAERAVGDAKSATDEVARQPMWTAPPVTFADAAQTTDFVGDGNGPYVAETAAIRGGDVRAYTPKELYAEAAEIAGLPVVIVGRVTSDVAQTSRFLLTHAIRLVGPDKGYDVYVGTEVAGGSPGEVVYVLGRVAAQGQSRDEDGRRNSTTYVLASVKVNGGLIEPIFDFSHGSDAILSRARAAREPGNRG
jgi:hypothetical protein